MDPRHPQYERFILDHKAASMSHTDHIRYHYQWLHAKLIGRPQPLHDGRRPQHDMVGLYTVELDDYAREHPDVIVDYFGPLWRWVHLPGISTSWEKLPTFSLVDEWLEIIRENQLTTT